MRTGRIQKRNKHETLNRIRNCIISMKIFFDNHQRSHEKCLYQCRPNVHKRLMRHRGPNTARLVSGVRHGRSWNTASSTQCVVRSRRSVHRWFTSYLHGRVQYVRCGSAVSAPKSVLYGVPQGSVFGRSLDRSFFCYILLIWCN